MKKITLIAAFFTLAIVSKAQIQPSASGVVYGKISGEGNIVTIDKLESSLHENKFQGKITGKVVEVCQAEGCWIKLQKADGSSMMIRAKNHGFFMPTDLVGKNVVAEGEAEVKEISEEM